MNCCICGPVKNCALYLKKIFENIEKIGSIFDDYKIILYYDKSTDDTLEILKQYQQKNSKMSFYINKSTISLFRTHNIAKARNFCLNYVKENKEQFPFFIMMDMDDVNHKNTVNINVLKNYLKREDWDGLSFNTLPKYYDIWGLSIWPYCFSYNHFYDNEKYYKIIQNYVTDKLNKLPEGELLPCMSSFNGFAIYKTEKFLNTNYDGNIRMDLIPHHYIKSHVLTVKSPVIFKKYKTVDGRYEDCEHRAFHVQAITNSNAKIMISPEIIFT